LKTKRLKAITSTVTGLAGPGKKIAAFMPCTVIECDDVADQLLDRTKNPDWQGLKLRALDAMPTNLELWEQYWEIRCEDMVAEKGVARSNQFYADNREAMDAGAVATWPERFEPDELSAVQSAMNVYLAKPMKFAAEMQNEPLRDQELTSALTADDIRSRVNGLGRRVVPSEAQFLTAFTDVHADLLYWMVIAWRQDFTGWVVDYGTYPEQPRRQFTLRKARPKLGEKHGGGVLEAALAGGFQAVCEDLLPIGWKRTAGDDLRVGFMPIDAHWGDSTDTVKLFCKTSSFASQIIPSFGTFIGATSAPMSAKKPKPGDVVGPEWIIPHGKNHLTFDSNHWKSFVAARLRVPVGAPSAITIFGDRPDRHDLLASHWTSEYPKPAKSGKREIDEWKLRLGRDNHWWDCLVGCAVAASKLGVRLPEAHAAKRKRKVVSYAEQQRQAKEQREKKSA
jgi:phage terminase large subunit GpA-like protein